MLNKLLNGGFKKDELVLLVVKSRPKSKVVDTKTREEKERFILTLRDNKDLSFSRFIRVLEEANSMLNMQVVSNRIDRNGLIRDVIEAANNYIEAEDTLYKHKKELGVRTLTRHYNAIPDNFHGYIILNHLLPSYVTWKRERDIAMVNEMIKNK